MCIFSDRATRAHVAPDAPDAPEGWRTFEVLGLDDGTLQLRSPQQGASWVATPHEAGGWLLDGRGAHDVDLFGHGLYVVDDPQRAIHSCETTLLRVRPCHEVARHERPGGWRATSVVIVGQHAGPQEPPEWALKLAGEGLAARLHARATRVSGFDSVHIPGIPTVGEAGTMPPDDVVKVAREYAHDSTGGGYGEKDWLALPIVVIAEPDTLERVRAIVKEEPGRHSRLAGSSASANQLLTHVLAEYLGARLVRLRHEGEADEERGTRENAAKVAAAAAERGAVARIDDIAARVVALDDAQWVWAAERARARARTERRKYQRREREMLRFPRELVKRLRTDPAGAAQWLREFPAADRRSYGVQRGSDGASVTFRAPGALTLPAWGDGRYGWQTAPEGRWRLAPSRDGWTLALVSRAGGMTVRAYWDGTRWAPCGTAYSEYTSAGWSGVSYSTRAARTLAALTGNGSRWGIKAIGPDASSYSRYQRDNRALLERTAIRTIDRAEKRAERIVSAAIERATA